MADKNFNQGQQSQQDWDRDRNRANQDNDWLHQQGNSQHRESNDNYRDVGYSGDSSRGMGTSNQGSYGRSNYASNSDENRNFGNRNYNNSQYGTSGDYGGSGMDYNPGGYRSENRGSFGNAGYDQNYGQSDKSRGHGDAGYGSSFDNDNDWNQRQRYQNSSNNWSNNEGRQDWGRGSVNDGGYNSQQAYGNRNMGDGNYGNRMGSSYGSSSSGYGSMRDDYNNMRNDYNRSNWDRNRYDRDNRHRDNDNWWEKTKDKVSSWFNDDDRNDRNRGTYASHRGKGPSDYRRSDDRIREDICDRLTDDDRIDASNIRVQIENDAVVLSGTVNSREEKRRAEDLVESISGVRNVENRLRVGSSLSSHEYTGNTDNIGGIGNESGTTNEIIRNTQNERESGVAGSGKTKNP